MAKIIISYRRTDADMFAGRVRDRIAARFGEQSVFIDVDNIPFGKDFRVHIQEEMAKADAVLVVIGSKWLGVGKGGLSRIKEETDPVRIEVETALTKGIPTIPILVGQTRMPRPEQLPDNLKDFSFINAAPVDTGRDFHRDLDRIIATIDGILEPKATRQEQASTVPEIPAMAKTPPAIAITLDEAPTGNLDTGEKAQSAFATLAGSPGRAVLKGKARDTAYQAATAKPRARHGGRIAAGVALGGVLALGLVWVVVKPAVNNAPPPASAPAVPAPTADASEPPPQSSAAPLLQQPPLGAPQQLQDAAAQPAGGASGAQPAASLPAATPSAAPADPGAEIVREFYQHLSEGDGGAASKLVVAEKRTGNFSPQKMTQLFGSVFYARLRLLNLVRSGQNAYQATYTFQKSERGPVCNNTVTVNIVQRQGHNFIQSIQSPPNGC